MPLSPFFRPTTHLTSSVSLVSLRPPQNFPRQTPTGRLSTTSLLSLPQLTVSTCFLFASPSFFAFLRSSIKRRSFWLQTTSRPRKPLNGTRARLTSDLASPSFLPACPSTLHPRPASPVDGVCTFAHEDTGNQAEFDFFTHALAP